VIIIPIVIFLVYVLFNAKRDVRQAAVKEDTKESADATTRLIIVLVVGLVLLAIATGNAG
jgi:uncharacterized membrane protein